MSVGPMGGIGGGAAGSPLAQTKGSDVERARQDAGNQERRVQTDRKAESAAGIGEADGEDHEAAERDADGRRLWEEPEKVDTQNEPSDESGHTRKRRSIDATGQSGNLLDLSG